MSKNFKRKAQLTLNSLSFKDNLSLDVIFLSEINVPDNDNLKPNERAKAHTARVTNIADNVDYELIIPSVAASTLLKEAEPLIGRAFSIETTADKLPGKDYKGCTVFELEATEE